MSNNNGRELRHNGYQPISKEERGYRPTTNTNTPAPSSLPSTGSSTTQSNSNISIQKEGVKNDAE